MKLGEPLAASSSEMKTCRIGRSVTEGDRQGSSLGGYVTRGTASNRRWRGAGMRGTQFPRDEPLESGPEPGPGLGPGLVLELALTLAWLSVIAFLVEEKGLSRSRGVGLLVGSGGLLCVCGCERSGRRVVLRYRAVRAGT